MYRPVSYLGGTEEYFPYGEAAGALHLVPREVFYGAIPPLNILIHGMVFA
jgi:hypothetical protein